MRRPMLKRALSLGRQRSLQVLIAIPLLYFVLLFLLRAPAETIVRGATTAATRKDTIHTTTDILKGTAAAKLLPFHTQKDTTHTAAPARPSDTHHRLLATTVPLIQPRLARSPLVSRLVFQNGFNSTNLGSFSDLHNSAGLAWEHGRKVFDEMQSAPLSSQPPNNQSEHCPASITLTGQELGGQGRLMVIPCGLTLGSHITLIARPQAAHLVILKQRGGKKAVMVSQFMLELQGIMSVDGEVPPKIFHFNPRLKGDWCRHPVIEQNTCYRMQWGSGLRCEGWRSDDDEETVDGLVKCESWVRDDDEAAHSTKPTIDWGYPFVEGKLFVLTLSAGMEGYHVTVDGRHVSSFPYHPAFALEDATGLALSGDLDVVSVLAASLPTTHPIFSPQRSLQMLPHLRALPLPDGPVTLFIGILSAGNHFAERMAVRKSWISSLRRLRSIVVARFFVALHRRKEVNAELKREAEFFGDIVIVPYMDSYDLVVLKTVAICEFGVHTVPARFIMKCDDDTFVRVATLVRELTSLPSNMSLYVGNMNIHHKPMRSGKWAVAYEEWLEEEYPVYANGPGYILSQDIARFVVSEFENHTLRLFKMEDVSMGMWVGQFNNTRRQVQYLHSIKFCQFGCIEGYLTAHYQSPRQMMCLWDKLRAGKPHCCNMR